MKIQVVSDLHVEWGTESEVFSPQDIRANVLVFAGDQHVTPELLHDYLHPFVLQDRLAGDLNFVLAVVGNHEYYGKDFFQATQDYQQVITDKEFSGRLRILERESWMCGDTVFHGTTLWSDFENPELDEALIQASMLDFCYIRHEQEFITCTFLQRVFEQNLMWLRRQLKRYQGQKKQVVITHHAPSFKSINPRFAGNPINSAYASDLEALITKYEPVLWVHGHTHTSFDYFIGKTRVVCNPFGYFQHEENLGFNKNLVVEV